MLMMECNSPAVTTMSTWWRLCPQATRLRGGVLSAVERYLQEPATGELLREHEQRAEYPRPVMDALRERGLASLFTDPQLATSWHLTALNGISARVSGSIAISIGINSLALLPVYIAATDQQREHVFARVDAGEVVGMLLTEIDAGSNLLANTTRATPCPDAAASFRITGEKHLINGGNVAALLITLARTGDPVQEAGVFGSAPPMAFFIVERDETVEALPAYRTLPAPASDISGVRFNDTVVSNESLLGGLNDGFAIVQRTLTVSRGGIASLAAGAAGRARVLATEYAQQRSLYGAPLSTLGGIRGHLMRLGALDLLVSAMAVKAAAVLNARGQAAGYYTAIAKLVCCALAEEAVDEGRRVVSARALVHEGPYAQLVRDVLLYGVFDGTMHVMLEHLQWPLAQMSSRSPGTDANTIDEFRDIYAAVPRPLASFIGKRRRTWAPAVSDHVARLAALPGTPAIVSLQPVADELLALVRHLRDTGGWKDDQERRFEVTTLVAQLETLLAVVELADPDRRTELGMAPVERDRQAVGELYLFTLGWFGARIAGKTRQLRMGLGLEANESLDSAERQLLEIRERARHPAST